MHNKEPIMYSDLYDCEPEIADLIREMVLDEMQSSEEIKCELNIQSE